MTARASVLAFVSAACLAAACGGDSTPASPTPTPPASAATISVVATPVPLVAVLDPSGAGRSYRVTANLSFQETGGKAARITALQVTVSSTATPGWISTVRTEVSISVGARGSAAYTLPTTFAAGAADPAARWELVVTAVDADSLDVRVAPIQVPLTVPPGPPPMRSSSAPETWMDAAASSPRPRPSCWTGSRARSSWRATPRILRARWRTTRTATGRRGDGTCGGPLRCPATTTTNRIAERRFTRYFGSAAGPAGLGYYTHTLGSWHVIMLNSNLPAQAGTPQDQWLRARLLESSAACTFAVWHHPLFSSGKNGNSVFMRDVFNLMFQYGVDLVVNGDDHIYERFAPQDANGRANARGIRQFVAGTGGYALYHWGRTQANSEVFENKTVRRPEAHVEERALRLGIRAD